MKYCKLFSLLLVLFPSTSAIAQSTQLGTPQSGPNLKVGTVQSGSTITFGQPSSNCGPPSFPCAFLGDSINVALVPPNLGGLMSNNALVTDPLSGAKIFRISDGGFQSGSNADAAYGVECGGSADDFQISKNKTFFLLADNHGFYFLRGFDYNGHKSFPLYPSINGVAQPKSNFLPAGCGEWSYNNDDWFYDHGPQSGTVFSRTDVTNYATPTIANPTTGPSVGTVADFANALPGTPFTCGNNGGVISSSDGTTWNWVAVTKFNSVWVGDSILIYDNSGIAHTTSVATFISVNQITVSPSIPAATNVNYAHGGLGPSAICWHTMGGMDHNDNLNTLSFHMGEGYSTTAGQNTGCLVGDTVLDGQNPVAINNTYYIYNTCTGVVTSYAFSGGSWHATTIGTVAMADRFTIHNYKFHGGPTGTITRVTNGCITTCSETYYFWQLDTANVSPCTNCNGHEVEGTGIFIGAHTPSGQMYNFGSVPYATPTVPFTPLLNFPTDWSSPTCSGSTYPYSNMPCRPSGSLLDSHLNWSTNPGNDTGAMFYTTTSGGDLGPSIGYPQGIGMVSVSGATVTLLMGDPFASNWVNAPIRIGNSVFTVASFISTSQVTVTPSPSATSSTNYYVQAFPGCCWNEAQLVSTSSSPAPGFNFREFPLYNSALSPIFITQQGIGVASPDGTIAIFSSDWFCTLGTFSGFSISYCPANWSASSPMMAGGLVWPQTNNNGGYIYQAAANCTTGASEPAPFNQTPLGTQTDGTCVLTNIDQPRGDVFAAFLQ